MTINIEVACSQRPKIIGLNSSILCLVAITHLNVHKMFDLLLGCSGQGKVANHHTKSTHLGNEIKDEVMFSDSTVTHFYVVKVPCANCCWSYTFDSYRPNLIVNSYSSLVQVLLRGKPE